MLLFVSAALAAAPIGRDLAGRPVVVGEETVVVRWSLVDEMAPLEDLARRADVVLINTDPLSVRHALVPWLHAHGLDLRVVGDPHGAVADRLGLGAAAAVRVDPDGRILASWTSLEAVGAAPVAAR